jgi:hypothetical protein
VVVDGGAVVVFGVANVDKEQQQRMVKGAIDAGFVSLREI